MRYDAIIIGAGPAGYACAIRCAKLGGQACVIEEDELGGVCTNHGCIPTKTMRSVAKAKAEISGAQRTGLMADASIDYERLLKHRRQVVSKSVAGIRILLEANDVRLVKGKGKIISEDTVEVNGETLEADNIVIASGSRPSGLPGNEFDGDYILSSQDMLDLSELPSSLLIIGGGVIGVEYASIFGNMGVEVTLVEAEDRLLPSEDTDVSSGILSILEKHANVHISTRLASIDKASKEAVIRTPDEEKTIQAGKIMIATGRRPVFDATELKALGVEADEKGVKVDDGLRTSNVRIYAVGDVTGGIMLAHAASYQGEVAAENIMGGQRKADVNTMPWAIFSIPEIARVGLTQEEAEKSREILVGVSHYAASGKARCDNHLKGFVKSIIDAGTHEILGVHIIGEAASDLIGEAALAIRNKLNAEDVIETIHAHPTYPEMIQESLLDALSANDGQTP
ncbi:dihydrolipoyl dehydrogenase [Candidatus Altiarchaeota archaeon]